MDLIIDLIKIYSELLNVLRFYLYFVLKDTQCEFIKVCKVLMPNNQILPKQKTVGYFDFKTYFNFKGHLGYTMPYQSTVCPFPFLHVHVT